MVRFGPIRVSGEPVLNVGSGMCPGCSVQVSGQVSFSRSNQNP